LVYCQLEALRHCLPSSVGGTLDELPKTLDETYERILRGGFNEANREHAHRLLQCLAVAVRPLLVEELAEVLAVDFDAARGREIPKLNPNWRSADQHRAVLSTCSSLITIVEQGNLKVVQFSHLSVKKFLMSDRLARSSGDVSRYHILPSPAHTILALACLAVLLRLDEHVTKDKALNIPLAGYAAQYWVSHAQSEDVSSHIQYAMEYFFDADKPHWAAWHRVYDIDNITWLNFNPDPVIPRAVPLYYAALCGFYDLAKHLIAKNPEDVNARGGQMVTPLGAALQGKHFQVAELLYKHDADVNFRGRREQTPLHAASKEGLVDIVGWLLDHGADVNAQDGHQWVPLFSATCRGHLETCQMLLEHKADVHARNRWGEVPLHGAASPMTFRDQLNIMQLLLDNGADVNAQDNYGATPLHHSSLWWKKGYAPAKGTVEGSRLLLERGAQIDARNNKGKTPLQLAVQGKHHKMVEFLSGLEAK
jgi:ankyrin repeat protein